MNDIGEIARRWYEKAAELRASKHARGRCRPQGWRCSVRAAHKRQRQARKAQR